MIRYLKPLYLTDQTSDKVQTVKDALRTGSGLFGLFIITIAAGEKDVFDILPIALFKQRAFRHRDYDVIGIAQDQEAAFLLVQKIYEEYFATYSTYSGIREAFLKRFGEQEKKS